MANKTRTDINNEIISIIKSNPGATDTNKLQGSRHRQLLADIMDYIDEQVATALAAAAGDFPFDWTVPSNAFSNYSNGETTFSKGMWKFLHRDVAPRATLSAEAPFRQKGSGTSVKLNYAAMAGTAALKSIVVAGTTVPLSPTSGSLNRSTAANTNTTYTMVVTDNDGFTAQAFAEVQYLNKLFILSFKDDYSDANASAISALLKGKDGQLTSSRIAVSGQNAQLPNNEYIYIAYPTSFGGNPTIIVNNIQDNSFTRTAFNYNNSDNYTEEYYLFKSANLLSSTYNIIIQ